MAAVTVPRLIISAPGLVHVATITGGVLNGTFLRAATAEAVVRRQDDVALDVVGDLRHLLDVAFYSLVDGVVVRLVQACRVAVTGRIEVAVVVAGAVGCWLGVMLDRRMNLSMSIGGPRAVAVSLRLAAAVRAIVILSTAPALGESGRLAMVLDILFARGLSGRLELFFQHLGQETVIVSELLIDSNLADHLPALTIRDAQRLVGAVPVVAEVLLGGDELALADIIQISHQAGHFVETVDGGYQLEAAGAILLALAILAAAVRISSLIVVSVADISHLVAQPLSDGPVVVGRCGTVVISGTIRLGTICALEGASGITRRLDDFADEVLLDVGVAALSGQLRRASHRCEKQR